MKYHNILIGNVNLYEEDNGLSDLEEALIINLKFFNDECIDNAEILNKIGKFLYKNFIYKKLNIIIYNMILPKSKNF